MDYIVRQNWMYSYKSNQENLMERKYIGFSIIDKPAESKLRQLSALRAQDQSTPIPAGG
jgi:hypothetical protein